MAGLPYYRTIDGLPSTIPVFPLPGALLLPRGTLPLNIFEPRYVSMIEDALKSDGRVIGMIQPDEEADDIGSAHCFAIGCAGRIIQFTETDDGRYLITLIGLARYRVARELALAAGAYRLVEADYTDFADDMKPVSATDLIERTSLITHLKQFFHRKQIEADWEAIGKANDETLVTGALHGLPLHSPGETGPARSRRLSRARQHPHHSSRDRQPGRRRQPRPAVTRRTRTDMPGETGMASTAGCNPEERLPECHQHPTDRNARSACKRSVYSDGGVLNVETMPPVLLRQDWREGSRVRRQTNANLQDCLCSSRRLRDDRCIEPYCFCSREGEISE